MGSATGTRFSIIPEGEFKEEVWEWSDIEAMSRAGRLSPNTLIFLPDEDTWKRLIDTDLAACFGQRTGTGETADAARESRTAETESEESLLEQIRVDPTDIALLLKAAEAALAAGRTDVARGHYQRALEVKPYHPRVAQEARRKLPVSKWKSLRYLEKPPQVWETPLAVFAYPFSRGPLYLLVPTLALAGLLWTPWTTALALIAVSLWAIEIVRSTSLGETRVPLWHGLVADPLGRILKPVAITVVVAAELSVVFVAVAAVLVVTRVSDGPNVFAVIGKSPVLTVLLCTLFLSYFPAVVMLAGASRRGLLGISNPKVIVSAIRTTETEYLASVFVIALLLCATWGIGALVGSVPVLGRVFHAAATAYIVPCGGFVLGRLYGRFAEELDARNQGAGSDAE